MPGPDLGTTMQSLFSGEGARMLKATVAAVGTGVCTVTINGGQFTDVPYLRGLVPAVNDQVYVVAQEGWGMFVLGAPATPAARVTTAEKTTTLAPSTLAIWRVRPSTPTGAWVIPTDALLYVTPGDSASQVSQAAWFYTQPVTLGFATITSAKLWIEAGEILGVDPDTGFAYVNVFLHANTTPAGTFAPENAADQMLTFRVTPNDGGRYVPIPISWVRRMVAGTARGIAVSSVRESLYLVGHGNIQVTGL